MNARSGVVAALCAVELAAGCASVTSGQGSSESSLRFHRYPSQFTGDDAASFGSCYNDPYGWQWDSSGIDTRTGDPGQFTHTIGVAEDYDPDGEPKSLIAGATVRGLGAYSVEIVTSDDKPGTSHIVDLNRKVFSMVLTGNKGYNVIFSARKQAATSTGPAEDVFILNCFPDFGYHGKNTPVPLIPDPSRPNIFVPGTPAKPTPKSSPTTSGTA